MDSSPDTEDETESKTILPPSYYISRLKLFSVALKIAPKDKRALIGRSRAKKTVCEYAGAIRDINKVLKLDPDNLDPLADKTLNANLSCEFEKGPIQHIQQFPIRQKPDEFAMGVTHCTYAIENCVAEKAGKPLRDHFSIIRELAWQKSCESEITPVRKGKHRSKPNMEDSLTVTTRKIITPVTASEIYEKALLDGEEKCLSVHENLHSLKPENLIRKPTVFKPLQNYTTNIEKYMAEKYLDSLYLDEIFLKKVQTQSGAACPNAKGSARIQKLAKVGFKTVFNQQELLRTRRPFYYIKYQEAKCTSEAMKLRQEQELQAQQQTVKKRADVLLSKMYDAFIETKMRVLLDLVEKLKVYCCSKPKRLFLDKHMYLKEIYRLVREGFYQLYREKKCQDNWDQDQNIYMYLGITANGKPSPGDAVTHLVDHKELVKVFQYRLKHAVSSEETCWCYHELSRHLMELKQYQLALVYGRQCIQEARNCNLEWAINGSMLLAKINIQQHDLVEARGDIIGSLKVAHTLKDQELQQYLKKCLSLIEKTVFEEVVDPKALERRGEETIVDLMASSGMKEEATHLFQIMSVMPPKRRMNIVPGLNVENMQTTAKYTKRMSIKPQQERHGSIVSTVSAPHQKTKKKKDPDSSGNDFMRLIQYYVD